MNRRPLLVAIVLAVAAAVGCSGQAGPSGVGRIASRQAAPAAPTTTATPSCGDPTASLRPQGPLPPPGHMPANTFMHDIQQRGRLIVGVDQNTLLFGSLNPFTGVIEGFDIDMAHQVAQAILGDPNAIEYRAITSAQRIPMVMSGAVDMVARTMTINCDRIKQVLFSTVYYRAGQKVLVTKNSTAKGMQDLAGKKVCATAGSTSLDNIRKLQPQANAVVVTDWTDCLVALQRDQVDAISTDDAILSGLAAQDPYTKILEPKLTDEPYGLAINQSHPEFVRFVNGVLERIRADGTWASIYARWLGPVTKVAATPPPATYKD